jgi:hypothetical protein
MTALQHLPDSSGYDAADDLRASIEFAYRHIRERAARGGRGWRGWPEPMIAALDHLGDESP